MLDSRQELLESLKHISVFYNEDGGLFHNLKTIDPVGMVKRFMEEHSIPEEFLQTPEAREALIIGLADYYAWYQRHRDEGYPHEMYQHAYNQEPLKLTSEERDRAYALGQKLFETEENNESDVIRDGVIARRAILSELNSQMPKLR